MQSRTPAFGTARRALIICTTPRTGSKLLCDAVWRTNLAGRPDEYFSVELWRELRQHSTGGDNEACLREVMTRATTPNGIMSVKVQWDHMNLVRRCLTPPAGSGDPFARLAPAVDHCWLRRRDRVRQAVSLYRARATKQWHSAQSPQSSPDTLPFDYRAIKRLVATITGWESSWERHFIALGVSPLVLYYEDDLESDHRPAVRRILQLLDVDAAADVPFHGGPERQTDSHSETLVRLYHEATAGKARRER
jgi:LPS sulfotransferase NodH